MRVVDRAGPQHDQTFTLAAYAELTTGPRVEIVVTGTGSKAAKRGAAIRLREALSDLPD